MSRSLKGVLAFLALSCAGAAPAVAADPGPFKAPGKIVFCTELGDPPAGYLDKDGTTAIGFEIDLMRAIGDRLGVKTDFKHYKFASIFAALDSGQCDAVMSQTSKNPERLKIYDFVDYRAQSSGFIVPKGNPKGLKTFEDLSGHRVAVLLGSANERRLREANDKLAAAGKPPMIIQTYQNNAIAFQELTVGRVDAFASGSLTLAYYLSLDASKFEIGGLPVAPATLGIVVPKSQPEKTAAISAAWRELLASGAAQKIIDKWELAEGTFLCGGAKTCD